MPVTLGGDTRSILPKATSRGRIRSMVARATDAYVRMSAPVGSGHMKENVGVQSGEARKSCIPPEQCLSQFVDVGENEEVTFTTITMKLLDELIAMLSDEKSSLPGALLKTKVLLHQIGQKELVEWVNKELNRYADDDELPEYRIIHTKVVGTVVNLAYRYQNFDLPTMHLEEKWRRRFTQARLVQSLASLQRLQGGKGQTITFAIAPELTGMFTKALEAGNHVESAMCVANISQIDNIFTQVRSRLLDFVLQLKEELGDLPEEEVRPGAPGTANAASLFHSAVFGDGATIVVGNNNVQHVNSHNKVGDVAELITVLKKAGIDDVELTGLQVAIEEDPRPTPQTGLGPGVRAWIARQFERAASAAWNIELGIAGGLLTTALQNYYGL